MKEVLVLIVDSMWHLYPAILMLITPLANYRENARIVNEPGCMLSVIRRPESINQLINGLYQADQHLLSCNH